MIDRISHKNKLTSCPLLHSLHKLELFQDLNQWRHKDFRRLMLLSYDRKMLMKRNGLCVHLQSTAAWAAWLLYASSALLFSARLSAAPWDAWSVCAFRLQTRPIQKDWPVAGLRRDA